MMVVGVDSHKDTVVCVAVDDAGRAGRVGVVPEHRRGS